MKGYYYPRKTCKAGHAWPEPTGEGRRVCAECSSSRTCKHGHSEWATCMRNGKERRYCRPCQVRKLRIRYWQEKVDNPTGFRERKPETPEEELERLVREQKYDGNKVWAKGRVFVDGWERGWDDI